MSLARKIAWSMGSVAAAISMQAFSTYINFYYVDHLRLNVKLVSFGLVLYAIWNAINDPLLGQLSDRTRTRWGRRIPYILVGAIPLALAFIILWMPPSSLLHGTVNLFGYSVPYIFFYFLGAIFLFDGLYTLVVLNWTALYPEMYPSLEERAQVAVFRQALGVVGLIVGIALPPFLFGSGEQQSGWTTMALLLGGGTGVTMLISLLGSREKREFESDPPLALKEAFVQTLTNPSFVIFGVANMALNFSFVMLTATFPFFAKYVLHVEGMQQSILLGLIFVSALLVMPVWSRGISRFGARKALAAAALMFGLSTLPFLGASSFLHGALTSLLLGLGFAGLLMVTDVLLADIVDEDELKTGTRREGMYFGINGFFIRIAIAFQALILGQVLDRTGFQAGLPNQSVSAIGGLRALMSPIIIVALVAVVIMMWIYPLHGERLSAVKGKLEVLHREKASRAKP